MRNHGFQIRSFATPLKRMVMDMMYSAGYTADEIGRYSTVDKEVPLGRLQGRSFRQLTQTLGTDWGRVKVGTKLWTDILFNDPNLPALLVVDDVRFPNEYDAVIEAGGEMWKVFAPGVTANTNHPSEGLLDDREFSETIVNYRTNLQDLEQSVRVALLGG